MSVGKQHLQYLDQAINSVVNQTYPHWMLWIFFDTKKDPGSFECYRGSKVKILWDGQVKRQTIRRNQIIKEVKDDYICFLNADDLYLSHRLEIHQNFICKEDNVLWSYGDYIRFSKGKEWYITPKKHFKGSNLLYVPIGSMTFETKFLQSLMFDGKLVIRDDRELWLRAFDKSDPIYINSAHYKKRSRENTCWNFPHLLYRWRIQRCIRKKCEAKMEGIKNAKKA